MDCFIFGPDGRLNCFYCGSDRSIYRRIYQNGKWSRAVCVISDVRRHFSVMSGAELSLLCQESSGDVVLCREDGGSWTASVILESRGINPPDMRMTRIGDSVLYNLPQGKEQMLILQRREGGKWHRFEPIDSFAPFADGIYRLIELPDGRNMLIYRKNIPKQRLYFRLSEGGGFGDFKTVYTTGNIITDCSAVYHDGFLHFAAAVRGRFSSSLVYIRAAEQAADRTSTVLWEGGSIDAAAIRAENNALVVTHSSGGRLYTTVNTGSGFTGMNTARVNTKMRKAYVSGSKNACCCELTVPADRPYDIDVSWI